MPIIPPPMYLRNRVGKQGNYFLHDSYIHRTEYYDFDDTPFTDEFQLPVYQYAKRVMELYKFKSVMDIGCGSGFKLVTQMRQYKTLGLDMPKTVGWLMARYPNNQWEVCDWNNPVQGYELIIAADVIEHLKDPDQLLLYIQKCKPKRIILSTPERDNLCMDTHDGPPHNIHHVREWNYTQFQSYIRHWFIVREHFVNADTQILECELN